MWSFSTFSKSSALGGASPLVSANARMSPLTAAAAPQSPLAMPLPQGQSASPAVVANSRVARTSRTSSVASDSVPSRTVTSSPSSMPSSPASENESEFSQDGFMDTDDQNSNQ